ncbi:hypothetical protein E1A91_A12G193700v1 [Gossypium mustelinum]|uniref:Uncharacterized protein n=1 Tax=Gossypium mustelinum TaxID=34275 RepID=A0A5D2WVT6_GOSMU|nr:hypothetical protein E1A91_A12G193700v1 [Gossypium mustelinum]
MASLCLINLGIFDAVSRRTPETSRIVVACRKALNKGVFRFRQGWGLFLFLLDLDLLWVLALIDHHLPLCISCRIPSAFRIRVGVHFIPLEAGKREALKLVEREF